MATRANGEGAEATRVRAWLDCDLDAAPIEGTLTAAQGTARHFTGWVGLSAALERLRAEAVAAHPIPDENAERPGS